MAMGFFEPNPVHRKLGIDFSDPYHYAHQHIVVHKDNRIEQLSDLDELSINVRRSSDYWDALTDLQRKGSEFDILSSDDHVETEQLIQQVC